MTDHRRSPLCTKQRTLKFFIPGIPAKVYFRLVSDIPSDSEQRVVMNLYKRVVRAKTYIDENCHLPLNSMNIAGEAYFSTFHFLRLFKRIYGISPHQYLMQQRIQKAKELLAGEDLSITDICFDIGFESPSSFSVLFKECTGDSPSEFRQKAHEKKLLLNEYPIHAIPGCFVAMFGLKKSNFQEVEEMDAV